jgi:ubiquinone/menaquinone biosynthesis C-methylase UbiE
VRAVDYDERLHARYVRGSMLPPEVLAAWVAAFRRWLQHRRPLSLADVGSGTGRFTSSLAEVFGGPVLGIEPSHRMRAEALTGSAHPEAGVMGGWCEAIPLADGAVDAALLFGVWHHLRDRAASAAELARVVRSGGTLLLVRTSEHVESQPVGRLPPTALALTHTAT